jgi:RNA polymerase sigma factor (sigma-70 family)
MRATRVEVSNDAIRSLLRKHACGDLDAFPALVEMVGRPLRDMVVTFLGESGLPRDLACDVCQEVYADLFLKLEKKHLNISFGWLLSVGKHKTVDMWRKERTKSILRYLEGEDRENLQDHRIEEEEDRELHECKLAKLLETLASMPHTDSEILRRYYLKRQSTEQIAVEMNLTSSTVTKRRYRARLKLAARYHDLG